MRAADVIGVRRARIEIESVRRPERGETTYRLAAGERDVGQLVLDVEAKPDAAVAGRIVPILASLLASAIDRERLGLQAVEAEALRRSDFVKTTILRTLSHDLRSPLTAISAAAEMLDGETLLSPSEREELVASVRVEARRLSRLLSNLLDLSRLEADAARPRLELWTVDGLVARALEAIGPEAARVDVSLPAESATVRVDPDQVERVLVNLLENALKYSQGTVDLRAETGGRDLVLRVLDRGPGLDPDELERIFEPFLRGQGGGAGLGLAIARGFAQANGGRLWAEASAEGSCFAFALPLAELPLVMRA
jgi:two-component system sensor histidine kinase KdpD